MLLNEERQLKRAKALTVIAPTAHYTQSSLSSTQGRGRGRRGGGRGRGRAGGQGYSQQFQNRNHLNSTGTQAKYDTSGIICHYCEGKGHITRVCPSSKSTNSPRVTGRPSNLASTPTYSRQNWLMNSGTTHHLTTDLDNLAIHSEYQGPEELTLGFENEGHSSQRAER
uniref:CCHC-type domain-containing protein n=2 Tax=Nicotiana TaxID=4085 RepID=A0A1S3Z6X2_TOBAC|nr:PREDICTED: uncharacterized protein LOC104222787 [Nicotiana sylvestris]XP_016460158.1 PREDICTED: uncharacterized protein LOC107783666 [Nicotiana tabacum]